MSHTNTDRAYLVRNVTNTNQVNWESDIAFKYKGQIVSHKHITHYICSLSMFSSCLCKISIMHIYLENRAQWSENQKMHKTNCWRQLQSGCTYDQELHKDTKRKSPESIILATESLVDNVDTYKIIISQSISKSTRSGVCI